MDPESPSINVEIEQMISLGQTVRPILEIGEKKLAQFTGSA